jgi:serine/threonine protein kinase
LRLKIKNQPEKNILFFIAGQASPEQLEEFLSEITTMKRAGLHKNIVQLLGSCTVNQCLVMIMEYVPCGDLVRAIRHFVPCDVPMPVYFYL